MRRRSRLPTTTKTVPLDLVKTLGLEPGRELYAVVVCGPAAETRATAALTGVFEANRMSRDLAELVDRLDAWTERARTAEHLRDVYEERGDAWQERAESAERQIGELNDAIRAIESSVSWRITRPLRWLSERRRRR